MQRTQMKTCAVILLGVVLGGCSRSPEAKSARYVAAGKKLLEKRDASRAILQFLNAAQVTPRDAEVRYQLARAYLAGGDLRKGVASLREALELNPKHGGAQFRLAQLEAETDVPELLHEAQLRFQSLLQNAPDNSDALYELALTELKLGTPGDAMQNLELALSAAPDDLIFTVTLAEAKMQQKDYKGAEQTLKSACEKSPKSADAAVILGRFYTIQKRYPEAEREFQRALTITSDHKAALLNLAMLQQQTGRKQEAEQNYQRLASFPDKKVNPDYAIFLMQEGRKEEAVREFDRLARQDPDDRMARTRLISAYRASNRLAEADKVLAEALKKNPKDVDALLERGELLIGAKKYSDAEADLNKVLHLHPDSPEVHYAMAKLYQIIGRAQMERQEFNECLRLNPFLLAVRLEAAKALVADDEGAAALALLDETPQNQRDLLSILQQRNWALLATKQEAAAQKGVERGLATARTPDLLAQDAFLKISGKRYVEARQPLHEALSRSPEDLTSLRLLVRSYLAQNQNSAAVAEVRAYAAEHPKSAMVWFFLGQLLLETGDLAGAQQAMSSAKEINPEFTATDLALAQINLLEGNWKDARQGLNTILATKDEATKDEATKDETTQARQWLGMLEVTQGSPTVAIANFRKVLESQPNNAIALNNLAFLLAENGQAAEALKYAEKAVELAPDKPDFEDTLGWVLYRKGLYATAVTHLKSAVSKGGGTREQYHLAAAYFRTGDAVQGHAILTAALRKDPNLPEAQLAQQAANEAPQKRQP
jgi:tetratricopeptide (TPR) repeat protein